MDWIAISLTARLALVTSGLLVLLGVPLAYWLAVTRWRGRIFVEALVALPLVVLASRTTPPELISST